MRTGYQGGLWLSSLRSIREVYTGGMLRCAITDESHAAMAAERLGDLERAARRWVAEGIDFVQLREKRLEAGELFGLAQAMLRAFAVGADAGDKRTRLLINSRADVAAAAGADGVHLTARPGELTPAQVRQVFAASALPPPMVSVSCHTLAAVERARDAGVGFILFGPVFEKRVADEVVVAGIGLDELRRACELAGSLPVLALGGVTPDKAAACLAAGAAGVAGIRLFAGG